MQIVAVVLAAGAGRRMGGPKALLPIGEDTFLRRVCLQLERPGVASVVAVVGHDAARVAALGQAPAGVALLENPRHADGMLSSILRGLDEAEARGAGAVLIQPVDHPLLEPETVDSVVAALRAGAVIAVPSHGGRRGHPGGFARAAWPALRAAGAGRGARGVLADHPEWVVHLPAAPSCVAGVDTPADYARLVSGPRAVNPSGPPRAR